MTHSSNPFHAIRICLISAALLVLAACDHPLEIRGEGRIVSASGTRDCSWQQQPCKNTVQDAYQESYTAVAEDGWQFVAWEGCSVTTGVCSFDIPAPIVEQNWGSTMPPLVAVFERRPDPGGNDFIDDFSSNSLSQYTITQGSSNPQTATVTWQSSSERLRMETGDDTRVTLQTFVPAANTGILQIDIRPFRKYPSGGRIYVKLSQDEFNYYLVDNTDGYGPGKLRKYVDGSLEDTVSLPAEYFQNAEFDLNIYFSPGQLTVSGLPFAVSLTGNSTPLSINSISITVHQQDAYLDDIIYTTTGIPYLLAFGDSITWGEKDDDPNDGIGFVPPLEELLDDSASEPHAVFNEGIPGHTAADGADRIRAVLQRHPAADTVLVQFGSNDARLEVPHGLGLNPGDSGYSGSFKYSMQKIIDRIQATGKTLYIARPPAKTGSKAGQNVYLEKYVDVVDELLDENSISETPPDFYCYFSARPDHLVDNTHPNDAGYHAMAGIWRNMLREWSGSCAP